MTEQTQATPGYDTMQAMPLALMLKAPAEFQNLRSYIVHPTAAIKDFYTSTNNHINAINSAFAILGQPQEQTPAVRNAIAVAARAKEVLNLVFQAFAGSTNFWGTELNKARLNKALITTTSKLLNDTARELMQAAWDCYQEIPLESKLVTEVTIGTPGSSALTQRHKIPKGISYRDLIAYTDIRFDNTMKVVVNGTVQANIDLPVEDSATVVVTRQVQARPQ
jgi:hypothetical protein